MNYIFLETSLIFQNYYKLFYAIYNGQIILKFQKKIMIFIAGLLQLIALKM